MPLSTCPRCKRLFDKVRSVVCPKCQDSEAADYDRIRKVLDRCPDLNAEQLADEAEVTVQCVMRMLAEGLIAHIDLADRVKCGRCGAPAISLNKRLCQACLEKLNVEVAAAQSQIKLRDKKEVQIGEYLHAHRGYEQKRRV